MCFEKVPAMPDHIHDQVRARRIPRALQDASAQPKHQEKNSSTERWDARNLDVGPELSALISAAQKHGKSKSWLSASAGRLLHTP